MACGTHHCNLVVFLRNRTVKAYAVAVVLNEPSWLSGVLCYRVYKLAGSSVGRGLEGRATAQQRGRRKDLGAVLPQIFWQSPPFFFSKLQTDLSHNHVSELNLD